MLLKRKATTAINSTPIENKKINYLAYDIVGQGYAWLSEGDNLIIDSWENISFTPTNSPHDAATVSLLKKFAEKATQEPSNILFVAIGLGGRTPEALKTEILASSEKMKEGESYIDSLHQSMIYCNEPRRNVFITAILQQLITRFDASPNIANDCIQTTSINSIKDMTSILEFLKNTEAELIPFKDIIFKFLANRPTDQKKHVWHALELLHKHQCLTEKDITALFSPSKNTKVFHARLMAIINLKKADILDDNSRAGLLGLNSPFDTTDYSLTLVSLHKANLLTDENRPLIDAYRPNVCKLREAVDTLSRHQLLTDANLKLIVANKNIDDLGVVLYYLKKNNLSIPQNLNIYLKTNRQEINDEICKLEFSESLKKLDSDGILTDSTFVALVYNQGYEDQLSTAFCKLNKNALLVAANIDFIVLHKGDRGHNIEHLTAALITLNNKNLLRDQTRTYLAENLNDIPKAVQSILSNSDKFTLFANKTASPVMVDAPDNTKNDLKH